MDILVSASVSSDLLISTAKSLLGAPPHAIQIHGDIDAGRWFVREEVVSGDFATALTLLVGGHASGFIRKLSHELSAALQCDCICDAGEFGGDDTPFWSILFRCGRAFLVDDVRVDGDNPRMADLKIIREIDCF